MAEVARLLHRWMTIRSSFVLELVTLKVAFFKGLGSGSSTGPGARAGVRLLLVACLAGVRLLADLVGVFASYSLTKDFRADRVVLTGEEDSTAEMGFTCGSWTPPDSRTGTKKPPPRGPSPAFGARANRQKNPQRPPGCRPRDLRAGMRSGSSSQRIEHLPNTVSMLMSAWYRCPSCTSSKASSKGGFTSADRRSFLGNCSTREYHWTWARNGSFLLDPTMMRGIHFFNGILDC